ncbi:MAG: dTDP-4-dehydrorhamnose reductase [Pseudomonadota bacterium]
MYKKILVTGVNGQVGHALQAAFTHKISLDNTVISLDRSQLDLTNTAEIRRVIQSIQPDLIINPAAYTAVDKAETELELAYAINATAPKILAEEAARVGARLIHFSTDYVYNGAKSSSYTEDDATEPLSIYGKSKLAGEDAIRSVGLPHLIFRTSWVYGAYGKNFLKTILRLAAERDELRIVADQVGAPTSANAIANAVLEVITRWQAETTDTYHLVNAGQTSWHGFARAIVEEYAQLQAIRGWPSLKVGPEDIQAITTKEFPTPAVRPANSCLDCAKLARDFSVQLPDWHESLVSELQALKLV